MMLVAQGLRHRALCRLGKIHEMEDARQSWMRHLLILVRLGSGLESGGMETSQANVFERTGDKGGQRKERE